MRRRCENSDSAERVGGRGGVPEELLECAISVRSVRVCNESGTPCPLRAGGGGSMDYRRFWVCVSGVSNCEFVVLCLGFWIVGLCFCVFGVCRFVQSLR